MRYARNALAVLVLALVTCAASADDLRLATTTSTYNSGLLDAILPDFEARSGLDVKVIAVGTGKALRMGRDGDADVLLVHAPAAEKAFIAEGYGQERISVMYNDFVILGPAADPANIAGQDNAVAALKSIAEAEALFVSRGDDSGTHKKEKELWRSAGLKPRWEGYRAVGQGMGQVLQMADELQAYTLADRGTWLTHRQRLDLQTLAAGDERLFNPYALILIDSKRWPHLNHKGARALADWFRSPATQARIGNLRVQGERLFVPSVTD